MCEAGRTCAARGREIDDRAGACARGAVCSARFKSYFEVENRDPVLDNLYFRRPIHIVVQSQCHTLQIEEGQLHSIKLTRQGIVDCNPEDYHEQDEADCKDIVDRSDCPFRWTLVAFFEGAEPSVSAQRAKVACEPFDARIAILHNFAFARGGRACSGTAAAAGPSSMLCWTGRLSRRVRNVLMNAVQEALSMAGCLVGSLEGSSWPALRLARSFTVPMAAVWLALKGNLRGNKLGGCFTVCLPRKEDGSVIVRRHPEVLSRDRELQPSLAGCPIWARCTGFARTILSPVACKPMDAPP